MDDPDAAPDVTVTLPEEYPVAAPEVTVTVPVALVDCATVFRLRFEVPPAVTVGTVTVVNAHCPEESRAAILAGVSAAVATTAKVLPERLRPVPAT